MSEQTQTKAIQVSNYDKIKAMAQNRNTIQRFTDMLGGKSNAMSYISSAMLAVANSDALMECTPSSVFNSVMRAAALRLSCDPALRQAHIIPFYNSKKGRKEAQFIPGYIGLQQLAQRTGKYRFLNPGELYEGQVLDIDQLTGKPAIRGQRKSDVILGYFHYFQLFNGYESIYYMDLQSLERHGQRYAPKNPMWKSDFAAMCKKTVTRLHLLKNGILDPFDRSVIEQATEEIEGEITGDTIDSTFTDADDQQATQEAAAKKVEDANKPKRSEGEIMGELGIDNDAPKKAETKPEPTELEKAESIPAPMTLDEAITVETRDGKLYCEIDDMTLAHMAKSIQDKLFKHGYKPEEVKPAERKLEAITLIQADRKSRAMAAQE